MIDKIYQALVHFFSCGHWATNPRLLYIDELGTRHWGVVCAICGKEYEDTTV